MDVTFIQIQRGRFDYHAESLMDIARLQELSKEEEEIRYEQRKQEFLAKYDELDLFSVYASEFMSDTRRQVIKELSQGKNKADDGTILKIVDPRCSEEEIREKKRIWEDEERLKICHELEKFVETIRLKEYNISI